MDARPHRHQHAGCLQVVLHTNELFTLPMVQTIADSHGPQADAEIRRPFSTVAHVSLPKADPIYGPEGPLLEHWNA